MTKSLFHEACLRTSQAQHLPNHSFSQKPSLRMNLRLRLMNKHLDQTEVPCSMAMNILPMATLFPHPELIVQRYRIGWDRGGGKANLVILNIPLQMTTVTKPPLKICYLNLIPMPLRLSYLYPQNTADAKLPRACLNLLEFPSSTPQYRQVRRLKSNRNAFLSRQMPNQSPHLMKVLNTIILFLRPCCKVLYHQHLLHHN
jgi:hypothetical protein